MTARYGHQSLTVVSLLWLWQRDFPAQIQTPQPVRLNMDWTFRFSCCKNTSALIESNQIITCIVPNHSYRRALNLLRRLGRVAPVFPTDSKHWGDSGKEKPREDPYAQIKLGNPSTRIRKRKQSLVVNSFLIWDLIGDTNYTNTLEFLILFFDQSWK